MKKLLLYLPVLLIILYSCKKSNSGGTPPPAYYLSSAVALSSQYRIVDSFYYDTLHRIDTFSQSIYDSGSSSFNTWSIQLIYQGTNTWPSWYNFYDIPLGGYGDYHLLSYDANNRISKDTSLSGSGYVTYFSYPNGNIATTILPEGTPEDNMIDTLYISNGNVSKQADYRSIIPGNPDDLTGVAFFTDAPNANPAYHASISNSIGPLLFEYTLSSYTDFVDFISRNAWQRLLTNDPVLSITPGTLNYTLTTDNKGRLANLTYGFGTTASIITFTYY